jgi:hypothetical protein
MIGLIAVNAYQPEKGSDFARIENVSSGARKCVLVEVSSSTIIEHGIKVIFRLFR